jgi:succinate dehydrogenase/fumarate reductase flavoprotein subunit
MIRVWADEMGKNNEWVENIGGDPQEHQHPPIGVEYPELPGSDSVHKFHHGDTLGYSHTWMMFDRAVKDRDIQILYDTPGVELVQDGVSKEILGVQAERDGISINVEASRAVLLTCGGFENNQEMIRNYLPGVPYCYTSGTPYNEGDGIRMAMAVGADLWHMNNYAGPSMALKAPEFRTTFSMLPLHFGSELPGGMIVVGPDATRFTDEKLKTSHGKVEQNGQWDPLRTPCPMFMIFDHALFSAGPLYDKESRSGWNRIVDQYEWSDDNVVELDKGWITKAENILSLARSLNLESTNLIDTVSRWNGICLSGADLDHGRSLMMSPIETGPFFGIELSPSMLNTQGGPRRNERGQIVRPDNSPIPRLYSSGELGSIYSYLYQGTGNIGECLAFGRISGRNAAAESPRD